MANLRAAQLIEVDPLGGIHLTQAGQALAEQVYERHTVLSSLLMRLGVDEQTAGEDACRVEHVLSEQSFEAIKRLARPGGGKGHRGRVTRHVVRKMNPGQAKSSPGPGQTVKKP